MSHKKQSGSYKAQVDAATKTMHSAWNPIGHTDVPGDEYAAYAGRVVRLLANGADDIEIADYLGEVEQNAMGPSRGHQRDLLDVAQKIRAAVAASSHRVT
jgi:hypothetical protein